MIRFTAILLSISFISYADEYQDFESLLEDVSEIATKKSINVDYLPSVVSVVNAETLRLAGVQTLSEALDMLPGFQVQLSPMGYPMTTVRGLKNPNAYLSDKIKVMIDGVAINNETTGSSYFYMDFPLDLVEKIEVLRGPGSTMYGAGAFYATINVITKLGNSTQEKQLSVAAGSYQYKYAGSVLSADTQEWKFFADGYYKQNDKSLYFDYRDGYTNEDMKDYSVGFKAVNGGLEFTTRLKKQYIRKFL